MPDVTMPAEVAEELAAFALAKLWDADQNEGGCCPRCCPTCAALKRLLDADQLDDIVREQERGGDMWDAERDQVDRAWLERAWRMTECHS